MLILTGFEHGVVKYHHIYFGQSEQGKLCEENRS